MLKQPGQKTVKFNDIEATHGGTRKGNGLAILTNTGTMALTHRHRTGLSVRYEPVEIIGKLVLGPLASGDVQLGKGERILELTTGPQNNATFYKFKELSGNEKKAALLEF
ncbi:MAG: hypothetical protein NTX79_08895 [Candidatus Micrarchaeota archaeon]|nr:hypothetical protein [Candidatus Micrarchaeota archaeon]